MQQTDIILARFPGPVTLYISRRRKLLGLIICLGFTVFLAWLLFTGYPMARSGASGPFGTIVAWAAMLGCGALSVRAVILLLLPDTASLTLDADGFRIGHVFHGIRKPWRGVSEFRVATTRRYGNIGGPLSQVVYDDPGAEARRRGAKVTRVLPEVYGRPRLHGHDLAWLMNEWRQRALAQAEQPTGSDVRKSALGHLRR